MGLTIYILKRTRRLLEKQIENILNQLKCCFSLTKTAKGFVIDEKAG